MLSCSTCGHDATSAATAVPTTACPASCLATTTRSVSPRRERFFSMPATCRMMAASKWSMPTSAAFERPPISAASFTRLASSAPENPVVRLATWLRLTSLANGRPRLSTWTFRISMRPWRSGASTLTMRSKRPGRRSAESSVSGRLVAARQITVPAEESKPSSSVSSWFSVCSRSSFPTGLIFPSPRPFATASISSMNTMDGAWLLARWNTSLTRLAPMPT
mmetsp:Transcript_15443/g.33378  ORF Transcript_15443/g.33378 Transcript_15443/m.33378 type:complete len:221 (-) Transcript_15443:1496-2158(-)